MFCAKCGKEFVGGKNSRYCEECKAEKRKENSAKMNIYVKERNARLGLTNISIYKEDRDFLKSLGAEKNVSIAEIIKEFLAGAKKKKKK